MTADFITLGNSEIHYLCHGRGPINIVCLHGYGENASSFQFLSQCLPVDYKMIAIDLPYHGSTLWNENRTFTNTDIIFVLRQIFKRFSVEELQFIVIGYSLGGRLALSLLEHIPQSISKLILLAPDGMTVNFWYWLATQTSGGQRLFYFTITHPNWFFHTLRFADRLKLMNKSVAKFINTYVIDEYARVQLFQRWICMRGFKPNLEKIRSIIKQYQLPVKMLYGKHDRIILSKRAENFCEGLEPLCEINIIEAGHQLLHQKYASIITKLLTT